jgi:hypothetical protein
MKIYVPVAPGYWLLAGIRPPKPFYQTHESFKQQYKQYKAVLRMRRDTGMDRLLHDPYHVRTDLLIRSLAKLGA